MYRGREITIDQPTRAQLLQKEIRTTKIAYIWEIFLELITQSFTSPCKQPAFEKQQSSPKKGMLSIKLTHMHHWLVYN